LLQQEFVGRPEALLAITADALKIMTRPIKTRTVVTVNIQRSTLTRLAIEIPFHHGDTERWRSFGRGYSDGDN